jgi:hypothetical protein
MGLDDQSKKLIAVQTDVMPLLLDQIIHCSEQRVDEMIGNALCSPSVGRSPMCLFIPLSGCFMPDCRFWKRGKCQAERRCDRS